MPRTLDSRRLVVCTEVNITQFPGTQLNFSIQQPPALKGVQVEQAAGEVQAAFVMSNANKFGKEMSANTNHLCG